MDSAANSGSTELPQLPRPPSPSADASLFHCTDVSEENAVDLALEDIDIFTLTALAAMKLLGRTAESLVQITGDMLPTAAIREMSILQVKQEKGNRADPRFSGTDDVPARAKSPTGSPEARSSESLDIVRAHLDVSNNVLIRKFYSKKPPPIPLKDYLVRLHKYCPMSTGVYLASSLYIYRLALVDKVLTVTSRNVHRLVLASLRVAMKALEDLSYPQRRFAKVGGVSESELGRLEVSFCFVTNFDLRVDENMLLKHAEMLRKDSVGTPDKLEPSVPVGWTPSEDSHVNPTETKSTEDLV